MTIEQLTEEEQDELYEGNYEVPRKPSASSTPTPPS